MVSTRLRRRTTRYAPLLCSVLAMSGAEASGFTDLCSPRAKLNSIHWHRSGHVLGLLVQQEAFRISCPIARSHVRLDDRLFGCVHRPL